MRRRRPGRRDRRPPAHPSQRPPRRSAGRQLNPKLQRELKRANHLLQNGEHKNAARIFRNLGENAQDKGILFPAAMLFSQSAKASLRANEIQESVTQIQRGLILLAANQRWAAFQSEGQAFISALQNSGFEKEADDLTLWMTEKSLKIPEAEKTAENSKINFPNKCPYCGASMSLEQIKSSLQSAAECKYCGSVVLALQID